jgi:hypothetical protein
MDDHILEWHLALPLSVIEKSIIPPVMLLMMSIETSELGNFVITLIKEKINNSE